MNRRRTLWLLVMIGAVLAGVALPALAQGGGQDFSGSIPAVDFPEGLDWINVPEPLTWEDMRGKVVLLDFWTYGCINCIHIIPDLKRLEAEYADELVVIGVHSAKFLNEGETDNIRQIVQRYELEHPVVNDNNFVVWNTWGIQAWPTLLLVDPEGMVYGYHAGEGAYDIFEPIIAGMVAQFDAAGAIDRTPIVLDLETEARAETLLAFPGKVLADEPGGRLFVADSNHNRIVVADLTDYTVLDVIGGIESGSMDGSYAVARFNTPQGLTLSADGNTLYVADTENHTLRAVDLTAQTVSTIAGTGRQAGYMAQGGVGTEAALNSPWDLVRVDDVLYIAMAGPHQLWNYDLTTQEVRVHTGSGREGIVDGAHGDAQLAQPSGITTDGDVLYFADSEASAIRTSDVDPAGGVTTLVGVDLHGFGDVDGTADEVRLQHPLGVVYVDGQLYVADTYNSKIKVIDPTTREATSLTGDPAGGYVDGPLDEARFDEPGGLSYADGKLYVADTNNQVVRVIDLASGTVSTVDFANPAALQADREAVVVAAPFSGQEVTLEPQSVSAGESQATFEIVIPEGYKLNDIAQSVVEWHADGTVAQIEADAAVSTLTDLHEPVSVPVMLADGEATFAADLTLYYCEAVNENFCFVERVRLNLPVSVEESGGDGALNLAYEVVPPDIQPTG